MNTTEPTRVRHPAPQQGRPLDTERIAQKAQRAAEFLKTLAHEDRLMILGALSQGEKSVSDLRGILSLRQPAVSKQLARLRLDGLVATRRHGKTIYYTLISEQAFAMLGALDILRHRN